MIILLTSNINIWLIFIWAYSNILVCGLLDIFHTLNMIKDLDQAHTYGDDPTLYVKHQMTNIEITNNVNKS